MNAVNALYFDFDGTLVDTLPGLVATTNELRRRHGLAAATTPVVQTWIGGGLEALLAAALEREPTAISERDRAQFMQLYLGPSLDEAVAYPGVEAMLNRLAAWPLAIVTNKARPSVDRLLQRLGWRHRFAAVVTPDDVGLRKPDPAFVAAASAQMGVAVGCGVLFGDSEFDVQAAHAAGLVAAAVTWGYRDRAVLAAAKPHAWFDRPEHITVQACAALMAARI